MANNDLLFLSPRGNAMKSYLSQQARKKRLSRLIEEVIDAIYDYSPSWESDYTLPSQDAEGFSILPPSGTARIMYVSNSGNDGTGVIYSTSTLPGGTYDNPTGESAFLTISAALANVRAGFGDHVYLKQGDEFDLGASKLAMIAGADIDNRMVFGAYGDDTLARPVVTGYNASAGTELIASIADHLAVKGIHFTSNERNPDHADFVGWNNLQEVLGIQAINYPQKANLLIEDCKFSYLSNGVYPKSSEGAVNTIIRRNEFAKTYNFHGETAFGILISFDRAYIAENTFYNCGFWGVYGGSSAGNIAIEYNSTLAATYTGASVSSISLVDDAPFDNTFEYGVIITKDSGSTVTGTVSTSSGTTINFSTPIDFSTDNASAGNNVLIYVLRGSYGEVDAQTSSALTGAAETSFTVPFELTGDYRAGADIGISLVSDTGYIHSLTVDSVVVGTGTSTVNIPSTDFTTYPAASGSDLILHVSGSNPLNHGIYATSVYNTVFKNNVFIFSSGHGLKLSSGADENVINMQNVSVYDNLFIDGEIGTTVSGNADDPSTPRFDTIEIRHNAFIDIGYSDLTGRGIGWCMEFTDHQNTLADQNVTAWRTLPSSPAVLAIKGSQIDSNYIDNIGYPSGGAGTSGLLSSSGLLALGNVGGLAEHAGWTTIPTFLTSVGSSGDITEFYELLEDRRKGNWVDYDAQYRTQLDTDFAITNGYSVITQPQDVETSAGVDTFIDFDVYCIAGTTFQWEVSTDAGSSWSNVTGATSRRLDLTSLVEGDSGNLYRCTLTNTYGSYTSDSATLTVNAAREFLEMTAAGGEYMDFSSSVAIATNYGGYVECWVKQASIGDPTSNMTLFGHSSNTGLLGINNTGTQVRIRWAGGTHNIAISEDLYDGAAHKLRFERNASNFTEVTVDDGTTYTGTTATTGIAYFNAVNNYGYYGPENIIIYDIVIVDSSGNTYTFEVDSGSVNGLDGMTEQSNEDPTKTLTFRNTTAGNWS